MDTVIRNRLNGNLIASRVFAEILPTYLHCDPETQAAVRDMAEIVNDPAATEDERQMARATIAEALFPPRHEGSLGTERDEGEDPASADTRAVLERLDQEEAYFAERLAALMKQKQMSQVELAAALGVGQPAISMLLARRCRPQRRTVEKLAKALNVAPEELWREKGYTEGKVVGLAVRRDRFTPCAFPLGWSLYLQGDMPRIERPEEG
jgi:transcriptional regulator with XRE-family HTH domain